MISAASIPSSLMVRDCHVTYSMSGAITADCAACCFRIAAVYHWSNGTVLTSRQCAQVCDFGLALTIEDASSSVRTDKRGTAQYAAPELLRSGSLCRSSDVYSFGMIAWHLVSAGSKDADMQDAQICYQVHLPACNPFNGFALSW